MIPSRIALRPVTERDFAAVARLASDWDVVCYTLIPLCDTPEKTAGFLRDLIASSAMAVFDHYGEAIGFCGLAIHEEKKEEGELWYVVDPRVWGRGIATRAARALLRRGFDTMRLKRIWASCLPENPASVRVLEKIGMRREGILRDHVNIHGELRDAYIYAMLAGEWRTIARRTARKPANPPSPAAPSA